MKRITQHEVASRIYQLKKQDWLKSNTEEKTTGEYKYVDGVRYEQSDETKQFKPFWMVKKFDSSISIFYFCKRNVQTNNELNVSLSVLTDNEYYVVKGIKYKQN